LWDGVREARLPPAEYVEAVLRELPRERDEQIAAQMIGRASAALGRYLDPAERTRLLPRWERMLLARADDARLPYGMRKSALDALIGVAGTAETRAVLRDYLMERRTFNGEPLREPSRWGIIGTLLAAGDPRAGALYATETARDTTPDAQRRAYVAGAARPASESKAAYFARYLDDPELNEEWVTASLGAFHDPAHAALTLPHLRPSLERLEWIRDNRRIFFLPRWIGAALGGQTSPEARAVVDAFLAENPGLPRDLRLKVLQARDELERTVRIRRRL
ncbi:MAG: ERAP1-like C-terminal domain-containing protein, partial [Gemmatimonadota bacterium]|nr:ERAP1-like C-terminal domain-containing protein [Gemmatimonadota bacterium]